MPSLSKKEMEMAQALSQLDSQVGFFRDQLREREDQLIKARSELKDYQILLIAMLVDQNKRGIEVTEKLVEKMSRFNGYKCVKSWKKGRLNLELKERMKDEN